MVYMHQLGCTQTELAGEKCSRHSATWEDSLIHTHVDRLLFCDMVLFEEIDWNGFYPSFVCNNIF